MHSTGACLQTPDLITAQSDTQKTSVANFSIGAHARIVKVIHHLRWCFQLCSSEEVVSNPCGRQTGIQHYISAPLRNSLQTMLLVYTMQCAVLHMHHVH